MKAILYCLCVLFSVNLAAQSTSASLSESHLQNQLQTSFAKMDSVVLIEKSALRFDDLLVKGFAYKAGKVYFVSVQFQKDSKGNFDDKNFAISSHRLKGKIVLNILHSQMLGKINQWNEDSLQAKVQPEDAGYSFSGTSVYSLLLIDNVHGNISLKQSDSPYIHQKSYATTDRAAFIQLFELLYLLAASYR
jgi:hypothetical protein